MPGLLAVAEKRHLDILFVTIAFAFALDFTPIRVSDFWIQLKVGDLIRATGSIPATYLMTYTEAAGIPYVEARWLACLVFSHLFEIDRYNGMIVIQCILALGVFAGIVWLVRQEAPRSARGLPRLFRAL